MTGDGQAATGQQLTLPVGLEFVPSFANYYLPERSVNFEAVASLFKLASGQHPSVAYVWGQAQVGLSHLLAACAGRARQLGLPVTEISLADHPSWVAQLSDLAPRAGGLVLMDGLEQIAGDPSAEQQIFHAYNRSHDAGCTLVFASHNSPADPGIALPDLRSRLLAGVTFHIKPLTDEDKVKALQLQAHRLGMSLGTDCAHYMVNHAPRGLSPLFALLNNLDKETLIQQRRITIPLIKQILAKG